MRLALVMGVFFSVSIHAAADCPVALAANPVHDYVAALQADVVPRIRRDVKLAYSVLGISLSDAQIEVQAVETQSVEEASHLSVNWDWPHVSVHHDGQTDTLFAPMAESLTLRVSSPAGDERNCHYSGRVNEGYMRFDYYDLQSLRPMFADVILDVSAFDFRPPL